MIEQMNGQGGVVMVIMMEIEKRELKGSERKIPKKKHQ